MTTVDRETRPARHRDNWRFVAAILVALAAALAVYILAEAGAGGAIGYALMVVLPATLSAFIAWADRKSTRLNSSHT